MDWTEHAKWILYMCIKTLLILRYEREMEAYTGQTDQERKRKSHKKKAVPAAETSTLASHSHARVRQEVAPAVKEEDFDEDDLPEELVSSPRLKRNLHASANDQSADMGSSKRSTFSVYRQPVSAPKRPAPPGSRRSMAIVRRPARPTKRRKDGGGAGAPGGEEGIIDWVECEACGCWRYFQNGLESVPQGWQCADGGKVGTFSCIFV